VLNSWAILFAQASCCADRISNASSLAALPKGDRPLPCPLREPYPEFCLYRYSLLIYDILSYKIGD
jgi:hypothetical protein